MASMGSSGAREGSWFHFPQVEAKLLPPLRVSNGQLATHYFRELWVRAVDRQAAYDAVTVAVEEDAATVVAFGEVAANESPSSRADEGCNIIAHGRVYFFSDRGH